MKRVQVQALGRRLKDMYEPVVRTPLTDAIKEKLELLMSLESGRGPAAHAKQAREPERSPG